MDGERSPDEAGDSEGSSPILSPTLTPLSKLSRISTNGTSVDHLSATAQSQSLAEVPVEPIAIIGMSCRLPGTATDTSALWNMLLSGRSAWTPGPGKRFNMSAFSDPTGTKPGTTNVGGGHWLRDDVAAFDAAFFGINPVEAVAMDPQQRLLLEVAYETFENAGLSTEALSGSNTGVFVGQWSSDYHEIQTRDVERPPLYLVTGTGPALTSARISYQFNLKGPCFTVDTGCSSSTVALHQAILSLRAGETTQCFVGGANLVLDPQRLCYQSRLRMLSKEGRSFPFDSRANGYGRGEGFTGVVLKRLSAALRDDDPIRAVIRNSVLNQDGKTPGIAVPSETAQREAIIRAYHQAKLEPSADYVEAHGTGTKTGDPIEARAIASVLSQNRQPGQELPIGSIKGNIGHTEGSAGLAGVIKAVLMLEHGIIPPQVNFSEPNPELHLDEWHIRVPKEPERKSLKRISVNSFGYGGTNAHVILDSATDFRLHMSASSAQGQQAGLLVFVLSAASNSSLQATCKRLANYLISKQRSMPGPYRETLLHRLAYTLSRRTLLPHRLSLVSATIEDLISKLLAESNTQTSPFATPQLNGISGAPEKRIAFVFSGQGAQYAEMGRSLLQAQYPTFSRSLDRANTQYSKLGCSWDLVAELCRPDADSRINDPAFAQPISTAVQLALVDLMADLGLVPSATVGHSSGEIAAAYAAGILSFEDAATAAFYRGSLTGELLGRTDAARGAMLAVGDAPEVVEDHIALLTSETVGGRMRIACYNSPSSVTVSGDEPAIDELRTLLEKRGTFNRKLLTRGAAYHSHQMESIATPYSQSLSALCPHISWPSGSVSKPVHMYSSVTGQVVDESTVLDGAYWARNLLSPVRFSYAVQCMLEKEPDVDTIVEVGPHAQLEGPLRQILKTLPGNRAKIAYTSTLKRKTDAEESLLKCLGFLHAQDHHQVGLQNLNDRSGEHSSTQNRDGHAKSLLLVDLPPYCFDHDRTFWHETRLSREYRHRPHLPHELLGTLSPDVNRLEPRWRKFLSLKESPWLKYHVVQGQIVFPAAGFLNMAMQAALQHALMQASSTAQPAGQVKKSSVGALLFRNISINKALVLSEDEDQEVSLSLRPQARTARESSEVWNEFRIFSVASDGLWTEHCRGLVHLELNRSEERDHISNAKWWTQVTELDPIAARCVLADAPRKFYFLARENAGLNWDHPFKNLTSVWSDKTMRECFTTSRVPNVGASGPGGVGDLVHPGLLDSALFHGICFLAFQGQKGTEKTAVVPTFIKELRVANQSITATEIKEVVSITTINEDVSAPYNVVIQRKHGCKREGIILQARGIRVVPLPQNVSTSQQRRDLCHSSEWVTYMDLPWTSQHLTKLCKSTISLESIANLNRSLEALTIHYVQRTLQQVSPQDIPARSHFRYMYEWMVSLSNHTYDPSFINDLNLAADPMGEAIIRLGPHLPDILTEKTVPLSILTQDNLLSRIYAGTRPNRCCTQMAAWAKELGRFSPGLRVLEIGAGTGSATVPILEAIGEYVGQYDFTDLSTGFFEAAKQRLGGLASGKVEYKVLDAEKDPLEQGFKAESYDLVIASNVIHATRRIDDTLRRVRSLLRPGGRFFLLEITEYQVFYNIIFGTFEGWWAGYDEGRKQSPLQTVTQWTNRLRNAGFICDNQPVFTDYDQDNGGTIGVFISQVPELLSVTEVQAPPPIVLLAASEKHKLDIQESVGLLRTALGLEASVLVENINDGLTGNGIVVVLPEVGDVLHDGVEDHTWMAFKNRVLTARAVLFVDAPLESNEASRPRAGLWSGFMRCLHLEHPDIRFVTLQLQPSAVGTRLSVVERLAATLPTLLARPTFDLSSNEEVDDEFAEKDGQLFVTRLIGFSEMNSDLHRNHQQADPEFTSFITPGRTMKAELGIPGLLETIHWQDDTDAPIFGSIGPNDVRIELKAASINFKDVLIAAGQLDGITEMRNDCSGLVVEVGLNMQSRFRPGDRVCGLYSRSYTNYPMVHGDCVQVIPESMSFAEGAALPIVWTTVYYSVLELGKLKRGDKILIHSAAGAVGQAAITLAQHLGAEVFATVGGEAKRELLQTRYGIAPDHIFSSRSPGFCEEVRRLTKNYGVDVVLNSLSGEMFRLSCELVAPFGRFVEIGRKDLMDDALMPTQFLLRNVTFAYVDFAAVIDQNKPLAGRLLRSVVALASAGSIRPVTITTMNISEIESAFRLIQAGKHMGKLVLTVDDDQLVMAIPPVPDRLSLKEDATYIVAGGLGGLGKALVTWLADCGAKHILTLSRSGGRDTRSAEVIDEMRARDVTVVTQACDIASEEQVAAVVQAVNDGQLPPVRGIIQSAMVLRDSMFQDMTSQEWNEALAPKVRGTINLDNAFGSGGRLDFFAMLSSAVSVAGNFGQSNYAAACSFQDSLARHEPPSGNHFYSVNVGAILEVGYVSENPEAAEVLKRCGLEVMSITDLVSVLNSALTRKEYFVGRDNRCVTGILASPDSKSASWLRQKRFAHLQQQGKAGFNSGGNELVANVGVQLGAVQRFEDAVDIVCQQILQQLGKLIATPVDMLTAARSLDSYGVDSLVLVELRNWIGAYLQATVQLMTLRGASNIRELAKIVAKESRLVDLEAAE
ncbi:polyketide synthase [Cladorrhinum sp. PSN259]|nr:polyketide synthase [Cladorrhinum sp. PSN259]